MPDAYSPRLKRIIEHKGPESVIEIKMAQALDKLHIPHEPQKKIGPYFADLFVPIANIVIECDGKMHRDRYETDKKRDEYMENLGYCVMRFEGKQILDNPDYCAAMVESVARTKNMQAVNELNAMRRGFSRAMSMPAGIRDFKSLPEDRQEWCVVHKRLEWPDGRPVEDNEE